jgi:signal peptidase II
MKRFRFFLIALVIFLLDQFTKTLVVSRLSLQEARTVIPGFLDFVYTQNTGIAFSLFAENSSTWAPLALALVSALALAGFLFIAFRSPVQSLRLEWGLMLLLGGAAGNLMDRVRFGFVIDFIDVYIRSFHWYTFNIADSAITTGIGLLLLETLTHQTAQTNGQQV